MRNGAAVLAATATLLSGCAGMGVPPVGDAMQRPVSEQPTTTDAQAAAKIHVELGTAYFQAGRFGVALDEARLAQAIDPNYAPTYHLMGQVYMFLDEPESARSSFERAARLAPGDPEVNNSYGWFLCVTGKEKQGLERLAAAVRNPYYKTPTRPYTNAGLCHLRLKDDASAEGQFIRAAQADPKNALARFHLADIAFRRGALETARHYLRELHDIAEPTPDSLWLGIRIERGAGNRGSEETYAAQLKSRFPTSPEYEKYSKGQFE